VENENKSPAGFLQRGRIAISDAWDIAQCPCVWAAGNYSADRIPALAGKQSARFFAAALGMAVSFSFCE
jgi:hypothetical protein